MAKKTTKPAKKAAKPAAKKAPAKKVAAKKPAAKKPAPKKVVAKKPVKKVAAKKPAAKKPAPKKVVAKKPAAKKPAPKKVVAKKPVKKAAAKKTAPKKVVAKKPAKKVVAKKVVAKKPAAKPAKKIVAKPVAKKPEPKKATPKVVAKPVVEKAKPAAPSPKAAPVKAEPKKLSKPEKRSYEGSIDPDPIHAPIIIPQAQLKVPKGAMQDNENRVRYSDKELAEFKEIILKKLDEARKDYELLKATISHKDDHGTDDTSPTFKLLEDGSDVLSKEESNALAVRQQKFIQSLENALIRIQNKTYGICRVTGKLIGKDRLRVVPHATLSIEAKNMQG
ncbi:MAG: RNA polymerase-binding transcription factor DksA [Bacteroidia bacterium]|nr:RNA polymerase-binding transcription factor DksA [Bacteroidia bacterium]